MSTDTRIKVSFTALALIFALNMNGPLQSQVLASDIVASDDEDGSTDQVDSEDVGDGDGKDSDDQCGATIEQSRC